MKQTRTQLSIHVFLAVALAAVTAWLPARAQEANGVRVLHSDAAELTLQITPRVSTTRIASGEILPSIGGASLANANHPGEPMQFLISLPIALPTAAGNSLEVV